MRKRTVTALGGGAVFTAAVAVVPFGGDAAATGPVATPESFMQIVAHQDDDILFMNPEIKREYSDPSVTVYVTAGDDRAAAGSLDSGDVCKYSTGRDEGARAAHAQMAGQHDSWDAEPLTLPNGRVVEVDTLVGAPQVKLVFLRLHASGDDMGTSATDYPQAAYPDFSNLDTLHRPADRGRRPEVQHDAGRRPVRRDGRFLRGDVPARRRLSDADLHP